MTASATSGHLGCFRWSCTPGISNSTVYMKVYGVQGFLLANQTSGTLRDLLDAQKMADTYERCSLALR